MARNGTRLSCILPPHVSRSIQEKGNAIQRQRAARTLTISEQLRGQRHSMAAQAVPTARAVSAQKQRIIYDAQHRSVLPGVEVRREGAGSTADAAVNEAYDGSGATYDLYLGIYQRNSIDGNGLPLISSVHYQQGYDNAFWDGQQMVYGDGDEDLPLEQRLFNRFTICLDIIGHELTHGVTQHEARLVYWDQPGALNESFSDVFGSLVKQQGLNQTADQADWLIGAGLLTSNVQGVALRSMKTPGTAYNDPVLGNDPQPAHMSNYQDVDYDNGGVHINSGIPNHAFYLTAMEIGGYAWEKAGRIWYVTLRDKLRPRSTFRDAARLTYRTAGEIFGTRSLERQAVRNGWAGVGISVL